jgi:hypothetical protein
MIYLSLAYLIYSIVMVLVVGYYRFGPWDWSGVALGPVLYVPPESRRILPLTSAGPQHLRHETSHHLILQLSY